MNTPTQQTSTSFPNLEEIPYETNDSAGGYYLHFADDGRDSLYISKAGASPEAIWSLETLCKTHTLLVAALSDLLEAEENYHQNIPESRVDRENSRIKARAALALAKNPHE